MDLFLLLSFSQANNFNRNDRVRKENTNFQHKTVDVKILCGKVGLKCLNEDDDDECGV